MTTSATSATSAARSRFGNTHPATRPDNLPAPKPGTRRVMVALHATHSGVTATMPVTLPAWPDGWGEGWGASARKTAGEG